MFIRKKPNKSGSISVQIISKSGGKYHVHKTIGSGQSEQEVEKLYFLAKQQLERIRAQPKLFISKTDAVINQVFESLQNTSIKTVGPEIIFGKVYDSTGFNAIEESLFRHLVIARLTFPLTEISRKKFFRIKYLTL